MEVTQPAFIRPDNPETFKPGEMEKEMGNLHKCSEKTMLGNEKYQKILKGRVMGANMVKALLESNQTLVVGKILQYICWFELAMVMVFVGPYYSVQLNWIAELHAERIFITNSLRIDQEWTGNDNNKNYCINVCVCCVSNTFIVFVEFKARAGWTYPTIGVRNLTLFSQANLLTWAKTQLSEFKDCGPNLLKHYRWDPIYNAQMCIFCIFFNYNK